MNEYDEKAKRIINLARKSLRELEKRIKHNKTSILPEMLDERIKLLISAKNELYTARIIDLGSILCEENKEEQERREIREEEIEIPQEIKETKKRKISYSRV